MLNYVKERLYGCAKHGQKRSKQKDNMVIFSISLLLLTFSTVSFICSKFNRAVITCMHPAKISFLLHRIIPLHSLHYSRMQSGDNVDTPTINVHDHTMLGCVIFPFHWGFVASITLHTLGMQHKMPFQTAGNVLEKKVKLRSQCKQ